MDKVTNSIVYAKSWVVWIGGVLTAIQIGLIAANVDVPSWLPIATIIATAIATTAVPNEPSESVKQKVIDQAVANPAVPVVAASSLSAAQAPVLDAENSVVDPVIDNPVNITEADQRSGR